MHAALDLETALKKHFGYDTFRPRQREIVADVLAGRDVFALLPTGGGKPLAERCGVCRVGAGVCQVDLGDGDDRRGRVRICDRGVVR